MKILTSYIMGFKSAFKTKKLSITIYIITLCLALCLALPFGNTIEKEAGSSMAFVSLLKDFDYTVYKDFMNQSSKAIGPYLSVAVWAGLFYLILTIFFEGGILTILKRREGKYSLSAFWKGSAEYFSRFLRLAIYSVVIQIIVFLAVYIPLANILDSAYGTVESEVPLFYIGLSGMMIHLILFIFVLTVADYAKIMIVENENFKPLKTLLKSFAFVIKHFISTYFLYLSLLLFPVFLFIIYIKFEAVIGMSIGAGIFLVFIIQQLLIWCRVFIKIWFLGSELNLYGKFERREKQIKKIPVFEL